MKGRAGLKKTWRIGEGREGKKGREEGEGRDEE